MVTRKLSNTEKQLKDSKDINALTMISNLVNYARGVFILFVF